MSAWKPPARTKPSLVAVIASLDESIKDVRMQIRKTIDDDPDLQQRSELLASIPGLGDRTIPQLLACIGRPERFASVTALIAYASLTPMIRQSGTSLGKRRGTHPRPRVAAPTSALGSAGAAGRKP